MKIDHSWLFRIFGCISIVVGWVLYHFFGVIFIESIKFPILGIALILLSFTFEERQNFHEVQHES